MFIANVDDAATIASVLTTPPGQRGGGGGGADRGPYRLRYYLKISAQDNGSFTVTNTSNGFSKTYPTR